MPQSKWKSPLGGRTAGVTKDVIWQTPPAFNPPLGTNKSVTTYRQKTLHENQFDTNMVRAIEADPGVFFFKESTAGPALSERGTGGFIGSFGIFVSFRCRLKKLI